MTETLTNPIQMAIEASLKASQEAAAEQALAILTVRLHSLSERYTLARENGRRGYSDFLLARMEVTGKRIRQLMGEPECCLPYRTARHTADCTTVKHAPLAFADPESGLTGCGQVGPVVDQEADVTCDTCAGRPAKDGWQTYPGLLGPLTARQYEQALEEARGWLADCFGDDDTFEAPEGAWRVWNLVNANYDGGMVAFMDATAPLWTT